MSARRKPVRRKLTDVGQAIMTAAAWRAARSGSMRDAGIVLVYRGKAYGWKHALRDPQHERPGAIAIDVNEHAWIACGGDDYNGASEWRPAEAAKAATT